MTLINRTLGLTPGHGDLNPLINQTHAGQAHWAGSGPVGATCGDCQHLGYFRPSDTASGEPTRETRSHGCAQFHAHTGKHGPAVPRRALACKYFKEHTDEPAA